MRFVEKNRITYDKQHVYLSSSGTPVSPHTTNVPTIMEIAGVQSISVDYDNTATLIDYLGRKKTFYAPNAQQKGTIEINCLQILSADQLLFHTGIHGVNGYILRDTFDLSGNYCFSSGYLTKYSCRGGVGQIPQVSATFEAYLLAGNIVGTETPEIATDLEAISTLVSTGDINLRVPGPGSITINLDEAADHRVVSYELTIDCPRNPLYRLGSRTPNAVKHGGPISIDLSVEIENTDQTGTYSFDDYPFSGSIQNLQLDVRDFYNSILIKRYSFNHMVLYSEARSTSLDAPVTTSLRFRGVL